MTTYALWLGAGIALASPAALAAPPAAEPTALAFTGRGTQIYSCDDTGSGYAWVLKGPDARLFNNKGQVAFLRAALGG
jgi:hypothetical protein